MTNDFDTYDQRTFQPDEWLSCCHGYTHMPWCPNYAEKVSEAAETENVPTGQESLKTSQCCDRCDASDVQGQAQLIEQVRAAMAEDCDCELHRLPREELTEIVNAAVDQTNALIANGDFAPNFETAWLTAPEKYRRYVEENSALYWYLQGMADEQRLSRMTRAALAEDVAEMGRLVKERTER